MLYIYYILYILYLLYMEINIKLMLILKLLNYIILNLFFYRFI